MKAFSELGLKPEIQTALDELGYSEPTPIQEQAIPELLAGHDVIGQAQTGTGKTAAFGLPLLQYLDASSGETQAIVLTPTRELCIQVTQALRAYAEHLEGVEVVAVFGGAPIATQQSRLRRGAHVVVATVGRMMDLISRRSLVLTSARYVVLDEADEMLDLGFIEDVEKILRMCPSGRQTSLFSATMPPPIARLAEQYMYDPVTIKVTPKQLTVDAIEQAYVEVPPREKTDRLIEVLRAEEPEQAIIFCRTKIGAARLDDQLRDRGLRVKALHGDMTQGQRDGVMIQFKDHNLPLLVATDVAARGLDIEHVTHVINYDLPNNTEIYVHRIGRTGRVGRTGRAITFVTPKQRDEIPRIEREARTSIGEWEPPEERIEHAPRPRRREHAAAGQRRSEAVHQPRGAQRDQRGEPRWALVEGAVVPEAEIGAIRILDRFSFVDLPGEHAKVALERLDGTKLEGKQIRVEYAKRLSDSWPARPSPRRGRAALADQALQVPGPEHDPEDDERDRHRPDRHRDLLADRVGEHRRVRRAVERDDEQRLLGAGAARRERKRAGHRLHAHHQQHIVERSADPEGVEEQPERREAQHPPGRLPGDDLAQVPARLAEDRHALLQVSPERLHPAGEDRDQADDADPGDRDRQQQHLRVRGPVGDLERGQLREPRGRGKQAIDRPRSRARRSRSRCRMERGRRTRR